jgi:arylsulfatase A-like enzyme
MLMITLPVCFTFDHCRSSEGLPVKKPNVIIILADDQAWGDLSLNGNKNIQTPNIDSMASEGVSFTNFYVCPVSSPTRAQLLTGRYAVRGGVYSTSDGGERLDLDETTIADIFKKAGYATAAYGKWHNGMQFPYHPNGRGFDDFYGFCSGHWGEYFNPMLEHNGELVKGNGYVTDDFTNHGLEFIKENKDKPFFLYLPYNTPHSPMQVPDKWWNNFADKDLEMVGIKPGQEDIQYTRAALAMSENIDWNVGRVLKMIRDLGIEKNTIVVYFSDNGPNNWRWNGEMKGKKGWVDEGGVRVPLIIKWPEIPVKGKKVEQIAGAIDLLPTLADLAGIDYHTNKPLDGVSLKPLLFEKNPEWKERYIYSYWGEKLSVRSQEYRLDNDGKLFDIEHDRGQTKDVSKQMPLVTEKLKAAAEIFRTDILSELPLKDNRPFLIGDPRAEYTQIPARDGQPHGNIRRSNRWPNCSFFTNWVSLRDEITWDVDVVSDGYFQVELYYTCPKADVGSVFELTLGDSVLISKINEAFDPPLRGMKDDRVKREESYVKDWKPLNIGVIHARKGPAQLTLKALKIPGQSVMDFRLLMFKRVDGAKEKLHKDTGQ